MRRAGWGCCRAFARWLLPLALLLPLVASDAAAADAPQRLEQARFLLSDSEQPPPDAAAWQAQRLPDAWQASRPGVAGVGWYRVQFVLAARPHEPHAAYLPYIESAATLFVNGVPIGQTSAAPANAPAAPGAPPVLLGHAPTLFATRPEFLHAGTNTLDVRLRVEPGTPGGLSGITLGNEPSLRRLYERRLLLTVTGPQTIVAMSVAFGLFIALLWLRRRHESMYGYFALTALAFALFVGGRFVVRNPLLPFPFWGVLVWAGLESYLVFMCLFALRYGGWQRPRLERWLWAYLLVSQILNYASFVGVGGWLTRNWWLMTFVVTALYVGIFWAIAWQRRTWDTIGLAIAGSIKLVVSANERLLLYPIELPRYQPFAYLPVFGMIAWILLDRFVKSLNESERLNRELERRVTQKHAELEQNYRRLQQMERQQAVVDERRRLMSDMHDGIGGQLITAINLVERGDASSSELAATLRECLDDLRLTMDSLEPSGNDLLPVMGNLLYRLDGRLRKQGIALDWRIDELPQLAYMTPQNVLHVLRIVQEAVTNVVKHAQATSVHVESGVDATGRHVYIRVRDNGRGFHGSRVGRGLASMKQRAEMIGGSLDIEPTEDGTTLNLLLPVA